jgi:capsular exopolysaccharide synthesis family protein
MNGNHPLSPYLVPVRRWWPIIAIAVVLGLIAAWITLPQRPDADVQAAVEVVEPGVAYTATYILLRGRPSPVTENLDLVVMLARQGEVAGAVAERLGERVEPGSVGAVTLEQDTELGTLSITAVQPTAELANLLTTTYAEEIRRHFDQRAEAAHQEQVDRVTSRLASTDERIQTLVEIQADQTEDTLEWRLTESELGVLVEQYGLLQAELRDLNTNGLGSGSTFETLQEPTPISIETDPSSFALEMPDNSLARFGMVAALALLLSLGLVIGVDRLDTRVRTREDAEVAFGLPVVAELPRRSRKQRAKEPLPAASDPDSEIAEAFRALRLSVRLTTRWKLTRQSPTRGDGAVGAAAPVEGQATPRALLVTSSINGEGKSTVAVNLAASMAESGDRVLLVDCDFRRATAHELLGVGPGPGLHELPTPDAGSLSALMEISSVPGLAVIRAGKGHSAPPWLLADSGRLVEAAKGLADVVVFDTGPLLATNEASALTPHIDAVLLVARTGKTNMENARRATEQLTRLQAMVAGVALIGTGASRTYSYYDPLRRAAAAQKASRE